MRPDGEFTRTLCQHTCDAIGSDNASEPCPECRYGDLTEQCVCVMATTRKRSQNSNGVRPWLDELGLHRRNQEGDVHGTASARWHALSVVTTTAHQDCDCDEISCTVLAELRCRRIEEKASSPMHVCMRSASGLAAATVQFLTILKFNAFSER